MLLEKVNAKFFYFVQKLVLVWRGGEKPDASRVASLWGGRIPRQQRRTAELPVGVQVYIFWHALFILTIDPADINILKSASHLWELAFRFSIFKIGVWPIANM